MRAWGAQRSNPGKLEASWSLSEPECQEATQAELEASVPGNCKHTAVGKEACHTRATHKLNDLTCTCNLTCQAGRLGKDGRLANWREAHEKPGAIV